MKSLFVKGDIRLPLVVFIHGLGMDHTMWTDPGQARILGGKYPLSILIGAGEHRSCFHDLRERGHSLLTWSQERPAGTVMAAVDELASLVGEYSSHAKAGTVLIGHSRGGVIARRYVQEHPEIVRAVITISAPHQGSNMATWVSFLEPMSKAVKVFLDARHHGAARSALHRIVNFLCSDGVKEMLPESSFMKGLSTDRPEDVVCLSMGGTDPSFIRFADKTVPKMLLSAVPEALLPDEMREGLGDGLVAAARSVYPNGDGHTDFHAHHAAILYHEEARTHITRMLKSF
jgi:pimeloyl-ACP methyl ester carboxylesterase